MQMMSDRESGEGGFKTRNGRRLIRAADWVQKRKRLK